MEDHEAVAGLPESAFATEGFAFLMLFSGILFCLLPTLYPVPELYGKIEPLMGMALVPGTAPSTPRLRLWRLPSLSCWSSSRVPERKLR